MRRGMFAGVGGAILLATVTVAGARGEQELSDVALRAEMAQNRALAAYVARNGAPDLAESRWLADEPPWDDHEVTLYYLDGRKEIGFARAWILGRPDVQIRRYERSLTDKQVAALSTRLYRARKGSGPVQHPEDPASRADDPPQQVDVGD